MFAVAQSETGNGLEACNGCEMLPTKPGNKIVEKEAVDNFDFFVSNLYRIRAKRMCGFPTPATEITNLQFECLINLEFLIEQTERQCDYQTRQSLEHLQQTIIATLPR
ncbi:MAG: hypothetical protein M3367_02960 [Acidobacteriota bacterium]|nr:hypothetical protein [Acidobacteriota bacterium]